MLIFAPLALSVILRVLLFFFVMGRALVSGDDEVGSEGLSVEDSAFIKVFLRVVCY